jgi:uncharacterized protein YrrD
MKSILVAALLLSFSLAISVRATDVSAFKGQQSSDEWRMATYVGQPIFNAEGEKIGDVKDVLFERTGKITTVVIGVGGFLGLGEKRVALPFEVVTYLETEGDRRIVIPLSKQALQDAPAYQVSEKTTMEKVKETAAEVAVKASEKATELKDKAVEKIQEYREGEEPEGGAK